MSRQKKKKRNKSRSSGLASRGNLQNSTSNPLASLTSQEDILSYLHLKRQEGGRSFQQAVHNIQQIHGNQVSRILLGQLDQQGQAKIHRQDKEEKKDEDIDINPVPQWLREGDFNNAAAKTMHAWYEVSNAFGADDANLSEKAKKLCKGLWQSAKFLEEMHDIVQAEDSALDKYQDFMDKAEKVKNAAVFISSVNQLSQLDPSTLRDDPLAAAKVFDNFFKAAGNFGGDWLPEPLASYMGFVAKLGESNFFANFAQLRINYEKRLDAAASGYEKDPNEGEIEKNPDQVKDLAIEVAANAKEADVGLKLKMIRTAVIFENKKGALPDQLYEEFDSVIKSMLEDWEKYQKMGTLDKMTFANEEILTSLRNKSQKALKLLTKKEGILAHWSSSEMFNPIYLKYSMKDVVRRIDYLHDRAHDLR